MGNVLTVIFIDFQASRINLSKPKRGPPGGNSRTKKTGDTDTRGKF